MPRPSLLPPPRTSSPLTPPLRPLPQPRPPPPPAPRTPPSSLSNAPAKFHDQSFQLGPQGVGGGGGEVGGACRDLLRAARADDGGRHRGSAAACRKTPPRPGC